MRTITLELLRHGPPHNQLLSPLTDYLALCENHSAVTVRVPFEHNQMLYRLRALSYQMGGEPREFQVTDTARALADLLSKIPGLTAGLNRHAIEEDNGMDNVTHLRLVLSASELALLPFELATAPNGFPGAGQALSLQPQAPICITRETRRIPEEYVVWPKLPKILFVFASPPGFEPIPAQAHLLALRQAVTPWLALSSDQSDDEGRAVVAKRLAVVPDATVEAVEKACASGDYTHVHILAHGIESKDAYDLRFGLAFHSSSGPSGWETVSGGRLATILRTTRRSEPGTFVRPAVVTLASCHSGNVGSVTGVGASIGHALHESGIPMVIASQFPLSFGGSVMLVQELYQGLLWGEDPRNLLIGLRRRLHSQFKDTHDWASLTAYASLPPNFDRQLADACIQQAMGSINTALRTSDRVLQSFSARESTNRLATAPSEAQKREMLDHALDQVARAKKRLLSAISAYPEQKARILAQLASTEKREVQMLFHASHESKVPGTKEHLRILEGIERSRTYYWDAYLLLRSHPWELVQFLSLTLVLQCLGRLPKPYNRAEQDVLSLWLMAEVQSLNDADRGHNGDRAWAYGNLAELYLLAPLVDELKKVRRGVDFQQAAVQAAQKVTSLAGASSFHVFSTRRQVLRYLEWLNELAPIFNGIVDPAEAVLKALPAGDEPEWNY
jgi:CHAT domain